MNMGRMLSPEHLDAYKNENGIFHKLFKVITEDPELSFEIRPKDKVMVYYHKDKILTIGLKKGKPDITILDDNYYSKDESKKPSICFDEKHIEHNLRSKTEMRAYFKEAKRLAYFKKMESEFSIQQNIALGNHSLDNEHRYLVVDMEWLFSQAGIPKNERIKTRIDLIVVDTFPNSKGENDIYLAELKLGLGATEGASGTIDHVDKTAAIIHNQKACDCLREDVYNIIKQKIELGLFDVTNKKEFHFSSKPKMMLIMAYRGGQEYTLLQLECDKAKKEALKKEIDEPLCIMIDTRIKLG